MSGWALTVGSLFAGIGGFDLGLERAGFEIKWQVEIDPFCRAVLEKHWPHVRRYEDVRTVGAELERVDVICGGFPCQDISVAGKGAGLAGERSGLWSEYLRLIRELRPRYVLVENVAALLGRGLGVVLGDLAASGYDAEWDCIPASAVGAPHRRDRVWIVAYPASVRLCGEPPTGTDGAGHSRSWAVSGRSEARSVLADPNSQGLQERLVFTGIPGGARCDDDGQDAALGGRWAPEPDVGRVAHGIPNRVDRLKGLGNAIVPQISEWIGRRILDAEAHITEARDR